MPRALPATAAEPASEARVVTELSSEDRQLQARLVELLKRHRGNVAAVARDLDKPRTHVQRLMARLLVDRKQG